MDEFLCDEKEKELKNSLPSDVINEIIAFINNNIKKEKEKSKSLVNLKKLLVYFNENKIKLGFADADQIYSSCTVLNDMFKNIEKEVELFNDSNIQLLLSIYNNSKSNSDSFDEYSDEALFGNRFNNNDIDLLKLYFNELKNYELLTPEQEIELCKRAEQGDENAINKLVNHNLRLVANAAKSLVGHGVSYSDLIQEGNIGLMVAARRFKLTKECKFSTYAMWWIRQKMLRAIPDTGSIIRIPVHMYETMSKVRKEIRTYSDSHNGDEPSLEYIASKLNYTVSKVKNAKKLIDSPIISLDTPVGDEDDSLLGDFVEDESIYADYSVDKLYYEEFRTAFEEKSKLTNKEIEVLKYRNGFYSNRIYTLEEVGEIFNVTRERIRQIEAKALRKLAIDKSIKKFAPEGYCSVSTTIRPNNKPSTLNSKYQDELFAKQNRYNEGYVYKKPLLLTKRQSEIA